MAEGWGRSNESKQSPHFYLGLSDHVCYAARMGNLVWKRIEENTEDVMQGRSLGGFWTVT
jgi:hypothetical protein